MKKTIRLTSILLVIAMVLSLAPLSAFAAESDGVPTVVDVSEIDGSDFIINEETYDPDGFVFTGNNPEMMIFDYCGVDVTFKDIAFYAYYLDSNIAKGTSVTITLSGDNVMVSENYCAFTNFATDLIIDAEENASLTINASEFAANLGHGGTLTVNGGDINVTANAESSSRPTVCAAYIQNGGNVTITTKNNSVFNEHVVLNGGTLTVSSDAKRIFNSIRDLTIAPGAYFKGSAPVEKAFIGVNFLIAEGAPKNSYLFAKTSADGEFELIKDSSVLKKEAYLELKVDTHNHSFGSADKCVCGAVKADYSEYDTAMDRYNSLVNGNADRLIEDTKEYIRTQVAKIADEYLGNTGIKNNYTTDEQYILDGVSDGINEICDTIEKGIEDGTFLKPDYTAVEARIAEFEQAHSGEEYAAFIAGLKSDLENAKATNPETHADIADDLAAIEAKIDKAENCEHACHKGGFLGFLWKIANFFSKLFGLNPACECGAVHY